MISIKKILILLIVSASILSAQSIKIDFGSASLTRGIAYSVPVVTDVTLTIGDTVQLEITYPSKMIFPKGLSFANQDTLISISERNESVIFDINNDKVITYTFIKRTAKANDTIAYFNFEALAGSLANIKIAAVKMLINSKAVNSINYVVSSVNFTDNVYQQNDLRVERFHPNPFSYEGTLPFTLANDANVKLMIYALNGKQIADIPDFSDIPFKLIDSLDKEITDFNLKKGTYFLKLYPDLKNFSGAFTFVFLANGESKTINFMIAK